jgi:uracil-DNA glycosylase
MTSVFPDFIEDALPRAHLSWQPHLRAGLHAMATAYPSYLSSLDSSDFLPTENRLFAAFALPLAEVRFVLMGEGPYPRVASATGVCFMDGAVQSLWSPGVGLSTQVNRATSLRNFIKMLLVADGVLSRDNTTAGALAAVSTMACAAHSGWIQTGAELQENLMQQGFLLLNATLVFRPQVAPAQDAKAWLPFLRVILQTLSLHDAVPIKPVKLILWGKVAEKILALPEADRFQLLQSEHPYNLSFIDNKPMQNLFLPLRLLHTS